MNDDATPSTTDADRLRGPRRLLVIGPVLALLATFGSGLLGADGRTGMALLLLLLAVTFGATGVWVGGQALLDEFRGHRPGPRRWWLTAGMFVATLVCMTAIGGVAGGTGAGT